MSNNAAIVQLMISQQGAVRALNQLEQRFSGMLNSIEQNTGRASRSAASLDQNFSRTNATIERIVSGTKSWLLGLASAQTAMKLVFDEYQRVVDLQKGSLDAQRDFVMGFEDVRRLVPPDSNISFDALRSRVGMGLVRRGVAPGAAGQIVGNLVSQGSGPDVASRVLPVLDVVELSPDLVDKPDDLELLTLQAIKSKRFFGGTEREQIGILNAARSAAGVANVGLFNKNISDTAISLRSLGISEKLGLVVGSTLSQVAGDKQGDVTRSAEVNLFGQLVEMGAGSGVDNNDLLAVVMGRVKGKEELGDRLRRQLLGVFNAQLTDEERADLVAFQKGRKRRGLLRGRARMLPSMRDLLQKTGPDGEPVNETQREFFKQMDQIPSLKVAGAAVDKLAADMRGDPMLRLVVANQQIEGTRKAALIGSQALAAKQMFANFQKTSEVFGQMRLSTDLATAIERIDKQRNPEAVIRDVISQAETKIESKRKFIENADKPRLIADAARDPLFGLPFFPILRRGTPDQNKVESARKHIELLEQMVTSLRQLVDNTQPNVDKDVPAPVRDGALQDQPRVE